MDTLARLAAKLADDVLAAQEELGDDRLYVEIGNLLAASSQSLEEAFLTEIRIRLSERIARETLARKLQDARSGIVAPAPEEPGPAPEEPAAEVPDTPDRARPTRPARPAG